ncbi:hypothetical protein [Hydrogenophaga sp. MI9]|uniref:hypothetical protein n=1 Tax=Hydrogenophaga sp. MI9 TaxID=3453719 RepID=UPI003EEADB8D
MNTIPRDSRFCLVAMPGHLERCEFLDGPQHACLTKTFGPLPGGLAYIQEVRLDVIALGVNHLLELMLRGQTEVSMEFTSRGDECVFLMPFDGDPHIATIETCGINQQDLLILRASLACEAKPTTPAPVVAENTSHEAEAQEMPMKKAALIAALEHEWGSIEADLSEATRNGLKVAAHAGTHGEWYASKARAWAVSKGKIRQAAPVIHSAIWPGTVTRNRI